MLARLLKLSLIMAALIGLMSAAAGLRGPQASAAGAPLTLAYITSLTGPGSPEDAGSQAGFLARISQQNAEGGVNGHKLVPLVIDDQSDPSTVATGVQEALSKGAIGIVSNSGLFFLAAKYPNQAGVPVTGFFGDGPEWGEQPYTNMFASDHGSVDPKYPVNTLLGNFLRQHGGTVIASYGYGISPQSAAAARGNADSFQRAGGKVGVLNTTVPLGSVAFTSDALVAKQAGVNALAPSLDNNSNFALAQSLEQAGVKLKSVLFATGYEPDIINSTVWSSLQGDYFLSQFRPFSLPDAGTMQMQAAMEKYAHFTKSQFPTFGEYESWLGADLMIKGMQMAGPNPTHAAIIKDLRSIKAYNGNGLLPITIDYSTIFGHDAPDCTWILQAHKSGFVPVSSQPICGHDVAGTTTVAGS
jgi:branched-chain amino acid transport system substrate-binding protein